MLNTYKLLNMRPLSGIASSNGILYTSMRHLRGRSRAFTASEDEPQIDSFDEEMEFPSSNNFSRPEPQSKAFQEFSGERSTRSPHLYERAKQYANQSFQQNRPRNNYNNYNNNYNYNNDKRRSDQRKFNSNDFESSSRYDSDFDANDNSFNNRRQYQNYGDESRGQFQRYNRGDQQFNAYNDRRYGQNQRFNNRGDNRFDNYQNQRYNNRSDNSFQRFDNRRDQFPKYDRNYSRNQDNDEFKNERRNEKREYLTYKSYKTRRNDLEFDDNDELNDDSNANKFKFEDRLRENEAIKYKSDSFQNSITGEPTSDENSAFFDYENEETEETEIIDKKNRVLTPIPYKVTIDNRFEVLNQMVCPLHIKPYEQQLRIKYRQNSVILRDFGRKLQRVRSPVVSDARGLPCTLEQVKPSPIIEKYRNKDEFSVWPGVDGNRKTVGFFIGQPSKHHNVVCVEPDHVIVSKDSHKVLAKKFQTYLREVSQYDSCQNFGEGGNWRRFQIRSNEAGDHMVTAIMHPQQLTQSELEEEMNRLKQYFDGDPHITSMYFQASPHVRSTNEMAPFHHLFGETVISEVLMEKTFHISPDSFFQVNRSGAEVLYRSVISEVNPTKNTTILDICCGTGTLATLISPYVSRVIGIDSTPSAINNANKTAILNEVKNVSFITGQVEQQLPKLLDELYSENIVVVANPSRSGLHSSVINTLRKLNFIRKIVYVSCQADGYALRNFVHLCLPSSKEDNLGSPFIPINAVPVDMFPHTNHCELIVSFERF